MADKSPSDNDKKDDIIDSEKIREEDLRDPTEIPVDTKKYQDHIREVHVSIEEYVMELIQNGLDSGDEGAPNIVRLYKPADPRACLVCIDEGNGLGGDYDNDINQFMAAAKGTSNKSKKRGKIGNKGLGMNDYLNIAKYVLFTTMDKDLISRLAMFDDPNTGKMSWGTLYSKPITDEFKRKLGLYKRGTKVVLIQRDPTKPEINFTSIRKKATDSVALVLARNPKLALQIGDKWVRVPAWMIDNPERLIRKTKYGDITGAVWPDEKGNGTIRLSINGYLIETIPFKPVKGTGYINFDGLRPNPARNGVVKDTEIYELLKQVLIKELSAFPPIVNEQQAPKDTKEIIFKAVRDLIPKIPINLGKKKGEIKEEAKGIAGGPELGYVTEHEETGTTRPPIVPGPRINHGTVTLDENGKKIKVKIEKHGKEKDEEQIRLIIHEVDENKALLIVSPDLTPVTFELNTLNAEYPPYAIEKTSKRIRWDLLVNSLAECRIILKRHIGILPKDDFLNFEDLRMQLSNERVTVLKVLGLYPTVAVVEAIQGRRPREGKVNGGD